MSESSESDAQPQQRKYEPINWPSEKKSYPTFLKDKARNVLGRMSFSRKKTEDLTTEPLDHDQLDALRLETQHLTPTEKEHENELIGEANRAILAHYGNFIQHPQSDSKIIERYLLMDKDTKVRFWHNWPTIALSSYEDVADLAFMGARGIEGGLFLTGMDEVWKNFSDSHKDTYRNHFKNSFGITDDDKIARIMNATFGRSQYIHETTHLYEDHSLSLPFLECGAYYYQRQLTPASPYRISHSNNFFKKRPKFYQGLVNKYGDDVHRLFFGSLDNDEIKNTILNEFTPEVVGELFPNYKKAQHVSPK